MTHMLTQFEEFINEISRLKDVPSNQLVIPIREGKWSIIEIVGHLYYWDKYNLEVMVPKMTDGAHLPEFPNHDQHNEEAMKHLKDFSTESIINAFIDTRKELVERMTEVGEDVRFTIDKEESQFSRDSFIKIFLEHDIHHLKQINEKLAR